MSLPDKHGELGIWDARAAPDEAEDEDGDIEVGTREGGKYWRLQCHWPASSKSSISSIKFDPVNAHTVSCYFTSFLFLHSDLASRYILHLMIVLYAAFPSPLGFRKRFMRAKMVSSSIM
jgi:hypothetical protein